MSIYPSRKGSRRMKQLLLVSALLLLLLSLTTAAALGQDETVAPPADEAVPTDAEMASRLQPKVLNEIQEGNVKTITIEIPAGADTFTTSGQPNTNWSTNVNLRVGFNQTQGLGAERTFLFFSTASIPVNATVQNAVMRIFLNGASPNGDTPMGVLGRFLNSGWDASTLTWANYNPAWGAEIAVGQVTTAVGWREAQATAPVSEWVSGARPNFGIMLQGDETPQQRERIFTAVNANNGLHPRLIVTYQVNVDTTPPTATVNALPAWSPGTFTVTWTGQDNPGGTGIQSYDIQARTNGGPWQDWQMNTTATSAQFTGQNGSLYEFRARARDRATPPNVGAYPTSPQANTRVDTVPPVVTVNPLPQFTTTDNFIVSWSGSDPQPGSGVARFDVEYQINGGAWQPFKTNTTETSGQVTLASSGLTYGFRARGIDNVGNVQAFSPVAQASTTVSYGNPTARLIPFPSPISSLTTFTVQWTGTAVPGATIVGYDVQFNRNGGAWQQWLNNVNITTAQFTAMQGNGVYAFQVRARDNTGRVSAWAGPPGNSIAVDQNGKISLRAVLPMVINN